MSQYSPRERWTVLCEKRYDPRGNGDLANTVIRCLSEEIGDDILTNGYPRLYDCIDLDALESAFFAEPSSGTERNLSGEVSFEFADFRVSIRSDGNVQLLAQG